MISMIGYKNCAVCGRGRLADFLYARDYISGEKFTIYKCENCGSGATEVSAKDLAGYYSEAYYGSRKSFTDDIINHFRRADILRLINPGDNRTLLDVGSGNGKFFMGMRRLGWDASGIEIAPINHFDPDSETFVLRGDFPSMELPGRSFDVVTMWHSLEHFTDPLGYLKKAHDVLRSGGYVVLEIPNFLSWQSRLFSDNWFHLDVPRHTFHFSPAGLVDMMTVVGFTDISVFGGSYIYGFFGWLQSALNLISTRKNLLFGVMNKKISARELFFEHPLDSMTGIFFMPVIFPFACTMFLLEMLAGSSGVILIFARKNH